MLEDFGCDGFVILDLVLLHVECLLHVLLLSGILLEGRQVLPIDLGQHVCLIHLLLVAVMKYLMG